ncbi:hypothetical protein BKA83DRAFT_108385 [Pisolithus microcarpus]|nr:hypothetical protein BKA83DRAFT_108385 [Pisolithus microcarpus]
MSCIAYCYLCHDGSRYLFCCDSCPRVVCECCLGLAEVDPTLCDLDVKFKCPGCHELDERDAKSKWSPYYAFTQNEHGVPVQVLKELVFMMGVCERVSKAQVCADSILILHLVCAGMEHQGSLPQLLHMTLKEYHTEDSLTYEEVTFDLGMNTKLAQWIRKAGCLGAKLAAWDFRHKIIFVTVHSEVTCSDLFAGKNEGGEDVATAIEDFMHYIFAPPLHELVYASTLFMLTCGYLVAFEESFMAMKQAIMCLWPEYTILFTAPDFISTVTKMFTVAYSIQVLIQGHTFHEILLNLLNVSLDLHMHTDVLFIHISGLCPPKAPFGLRAHPHVVALSPSIIGCGAIRSWSQSKRNLEGKPAKDQVITEDLVTAKDWVMAKAQVTSCLERGRKVFSEPLQGEYELQGDRVSGWIRYMLWATQAL